MPLKFKIYYWCTLYLFLWALGMALHLLYLQATHDSLADALFAFLITYMVLAAWAYKSVLSLTAIKHYKQETTPTNSQIIVFKVGYYLNCLLCVGTMVLCIFVIIPSDFAGPGDLVTPPSPAEIMVDIFLFIALACATYLAVVDLALLKTIREKPLDNLLNFEPGDAK